ncbi:UDP-glucose 4-epimerase GalE [Desulfovibrio sp. 6_1_46AFAA]|uniref:UDP-glucose 4-epimerase GalE n=1 Tax=Desulfovibrio sp. 6_1_46AFAA TaxID=665942 RepID=UPI002FBE5853
MFLKRGYVPGWGRAYENSRNRRRGIYRQSCLQGFGRAGHEVIVYDNLSTGFRKLAKWGDFIRGDILDGEKLRACLRKHKPEGIIHFAAFSQVGESVSNPGKYIRNNVGGTLNILESMRDTGVRNIVVSSTAAVYGIPEQCPITEDMPARPINPYGETKLFMEWMLADFARAYGISWTALRYFNAAGADPEGECGECHLPETHLIPRALMAVTGELKDFRVMGSDYPTPDGSCIRDYIHVSDLAFAHVLAMERLHAGESGQGISLNLGTGTGFSVKEILHAVERVTERYLPHTTGERRAGDPPVLVADGTHAKEILHWKPCRSRVDTIIADAWNWHMSGRYMVIQPD